MFMFRMDWHNCYVPNMLFMVEGGGHYLIKQDSPGKLKLTVEEMKYEIHLCHYV